MTSEPQICHTQKELAILIKETITSLAKVFVLRSLAKAREEVKIPPCEQWSHSVNMVLKGSLHGACNQISTHRGSSRVVFPSHKLILISAGALMCLFICFLNYKLHEGRAHALPLTGDVPALGLEPADGRWSMNTFLHCCLFNICLMNKSVNIIK